MAALFASELATPSDQEKSGCMGGRTPGEWRASSDAVLARSSFPIVTPLRIELNASGSRLVFGRVEFLGTRQGATCGDSSRSLGRDSNTGSSRLGVGAHSERSLLVSGSIPINCRS